MHLVGNQETIDRLVAQGVILSDAFRAEFERNPTGNEAHFLRGNFAGWRGTLHTLYHDCAEEIVDRVRRETHMAIPESGTGNAVAGVS
jgi:hypothetical protein